MSKRRKPGRPAREPKTRQGEILATPVTLAIPDETKSKARTAYFVSLDAIREGRADETDAHTVAAGIQMAFILREHAAGDPEAIDELNVTVAGGLAAVRRMYARFERAQKWGLTGDELEQIRAALGVADELVALCNRRAVRDAARAIEGYHLTGYRMPKFWQWFADHLDAGMHSGES